MNSWLNPSHPRTLQAAVILGYFSGVFTLLSAVGVRGIFGLLIMLLAIGVFAGAFMTANDRRIGWTLLAVCAVLLAAWDCFFAVYSLIEFAQNLSLFSLKVFLQLLNRTIFPVALAALVLHRQSREYQRVWFR